MIELQLEKAGVRLAYLLDANLILNAADLGSLPEKAMKRCGHPAGVKCNAFQEGTNNVLARML